VPGTLFIVATPIGNLEDITHRALRVLREVDLIACEDTRHTRKLLNHFGITTSTTSYHEHNEHERTAELYELLKSGKTVALVSDAGTPLISDPGFRLLQVAVERGISVQPIPGAAAFVTALSAAGLATDQFMFAGFLPGRAGTRRAKLSELSSIPATLVFYEAPHRIKAALKDAREILGDREAVIAREMTKVHEEFARGSLSELISRFSEIEAPRGELVLIIAAHGAETVAATREASPANQLRERMNELEREGIDQKTAMKKAAKELGLKRDDAYRMLVDQKNRRSR
jgi:16S rRNA (cytidine1402-2'-O)-methyltransferase